MFHRPSQQTTVAWLAVVGLVGQLTAQGGAGAGTEPLYHITRWTTENGLPESRVGCLVQTRDGYLWASTRYGLARFDGLRFRVFDQHTTPNMTSDAINTMAEDAEDTGSLWIGTGEGLLRYHDHRVSRVGPQEAITGPVGVVCAAQGGGAWFVLKSRQVALLRDGRLSAWEFPVTGPGDGLHQIQETSVSNLLALASSGLYRLDLPLGSWTRLGPPDEAAGCYSMLNDSHDCLWVCSGSGLWRVVDGRWRLVVPPKAIGETPEIACKTRDGQLWLAVRGRGLHRLQGEQMVPFPGLSWPAVSEVTELLEDHEGNLWVGTTEGLFRLEPRHLCVISRANGLSSDNTLTVTQGHDGTVWVGSTAGIAGIREGQVTNLPPLDPALGQVVASFMCADREGHFWAWASAGGLMTFDSGGWRCLGFPAGTGGLGSPHALYEDQQARLWIGFERGAACLGQEPPPVYTWTNGPFDGDVRVIHEDIRGDLWFGTYGGGLKRLHDGRITTFATTNGSYNNRAWWIHEDVDGVFWVGSQNGLNRFEPPGVGQIRNPKSEIRNPSTPVTSPAPNNTPGRFFTLTTQHGLLENVVNNIQEDEFGYLWLSGQRGIYRVSRHQLNEVAAGRLAEVQCLALGEADGMLSSECNGGEDQPAGCKDRQGRIWFPTVRGVVVIDPKAIEQNEVPPPVVIEQVIADDEVIFGDGIAPPAKARRENVKHRPSAAATADPPTARSRLPLRLAPGGGRVLEIHYTANSFVAPERIRFQYRMEGWDQGWRHAEANERVAFYTNLRPGQYLFRVKACNSHGCWNEAGAEFAFSLAPKFSQTPWFPLSWTLAVLMLSGAIAAWRLRWHRRAFQAEKTTALERERGRIARDLHDDLGASLTGLALELEAARRLGRAEGEQLAELAGEARAMAHSLRELSWTTNPRCDNVGSLGVFLGELTERFCAAAGLECKLELPPANDTRMVPATVRHDLLVVVKESLANAAKHAHARNISLQVTAAAGELRLAVHDDGGGFDLARAQGGSGLRNLRERLDQAGGSFVVSSAPAQGTVITAAIPLGEPKEI
jgi:signal transduction histidine kinase/ligand-binding sensor domain-containing protein